MEAQARRLRGGPRVGELWRADPVVPYDADAAEARDDLTKKLKLLAGQLPQIQSDPAHVRARTRQALDEAAGDRIGLEIDSDDGSRPGRVHAGTNAQRAAHDEGLDRGGQPFPQVSVHGRIAGRIAELDREVSAVHPCRGQTRNEGTPTRGDHFLSFTSSYGPENGNPVMSPS